MDYLSLFCFTPGQDYSGPHQAIGMFLRLRNSTLATSLAHLPPSTTSTTTVSLTRRAPASTTALHALSNSGFRAHQIIAVYNHGALRDIG